jgi:RHS repeat-associated protein
LGRAIDYVWAEGRLLAKVETNGTSYFHHDHLGSSKLQTDDSGNVVSSDVTQPFGPRICADAVKDEFTTLDRVNTAASTIAFDATNGVVKAPHGANGYQTGELYTTELKPGIDARVVKLGWTDSGVTFYISTDGNAWSQLQKDQPFTLGAASRSLYLKAVLAADASSFLDRYLLQINPIGFNLFTGKMLTEETGLVYFGARWYDPEIGRWITPDPSEDGENWYSYCGNNPVNYVDPDGRITFFLNGIGNDMGIPLYGKKLINYLNNNQIHTVGIPTFEHSDNRPHRGFDVWNCIGMFTYRNITEVSKAYRYFEKKFNKLSYYKQINIINGYEKVNFIGYSGGAMISYRLINKLLKDTRFSKIRIGTFINIGNGNYQFYANPHAERNILIFGSRDYLVGGARGYTEERWGGQIAGYKRLGYENVHIIFGATHPVSEEESQASYWEDYFYQLVEYIKWYIKY